MGNGHILRTKARGNVKFRPLDDDDSTDSETEVGGVSNGGARHANPHPRTGANSVTSAHSSTPTVLDECVHPHFVGEKDPYRANSRNRLSTNLEGSDLPGYSDHEVDITSDFTSASHGPGWTPLFLQDKARLSKSHVPHIVLPSDETFPGAGRRIPSQNPRDLSKRYESPRWQAFWRDVNERIQYRELS